MFLWYLEMGIIARKIVSIYTIDVQGSRFWVQRLGNSEVRKFHGNPEA